MREDSIFAANLASRITIDAPVPRTSYILVLLVVMVVVNFTTIIYLSSLLLDV